MLFLLLRCVYQYLRYEMTDTTAHKTHATMETMVKLVVLNSVNEIVASNTRMATKTSPTKAITAATRAAFMAATGKSQHMANTQSAMAIKPAIQANHHPAKLKTKANIASTAGKMASLLLLSYSVEWATFITQRVRVCVCVCKMMMITIMTIRKHNTRGRWVIIRYNTKWRREESLIDTYLHPMLMLFVCFFVCSFVGVDVVDRLIWQSIQGWLLSIKSSNRMKMDVPLLLFVSSWLLL
mmetsp:Transcript_15867/g.30203  ORF Transcript_15867/g.30203 Transcript_15867/m.30203 type:complete len:239 (-) Transcript_15867:66-782(-)